jgi:antitoxin YefM
VIGFDFLQNIVTLTLQEEKGRMYSTYRLKASELDKDFIESLKGIFHDKEIEIIVQEVHEDETDYLLKNPANRDSLLKAVKNANDNLNLVHLPLDNLK